MESFVNSDTDGDGILDWEETLNGTDPTKRDSDDDGIDDKTEMATEKGLTPEELAEEENLTETDKLARELFATTMSLSQIGEVDAESADKIAESVANQVKNTTPEKIYLLSEITIINDNSSAAMQNYINTIGSIYQKYPTPPKTVLDVLVEFVGDEQTENVEALTQLELIITQTKNVIGEMVKMKVPSEIASLHLDMINGLQRLNENVEDITLFEFDPIVAMGGMSKYEENAAMLDETLKRLDELVIEKLSS